MKIKRQRGGNTDSIHVYYHIYCNEQTPGIVQDQINKIIYSGLYTKVDEVRCFLVGKPAIISIIRNLIGESGSKFKIIAESPNDTAYERFTLLKMHEIVKPEDKFLYIHSKGVTRYSSKPVQYWRYWMEYFLIHKFQECLDNLDSHDIVGVNFLPHAGVGDHFSGNFWWSTGKYFMSLPKHIGSAYTDPETYIFKANPKFADLDPNRLKGRNLYSAQLAPKEYVG